MYRITSLFFIILLLFGCQNSQNNQKTESIEKNEAVEIPYSHPTTGEIERLDDAINDIIDKDAKIEVLAEGFNWAEGPVWIEEGNYLLFSDVPENKIYKWSEKEGKSVYLTPSGYTSEVEKENPSGSNGLMLNNDGKLVVCQHGDRRISIMDAPLEAPEVKFKTIIDNYNGKKLNSPNDGAFHENGDLYFTDPPYGLPGQDEDPEKEQSQNGVYKVDPAGNISILDDNLTRPNGLAFSPDFDKLYVAVSDMLKPVWMVYDVKDNGMVENGKIFFDAGELAKTRSGYPDGLKVNSKGILFATGPGGVLVFNADGKHLGTVLTGHDTANCALDTKQEYLYMTADDYLMRIKLL